MIRSERSSNLGIGEVEQPSVVTAGTPAELPFVSVLMPVRNEADFIERSLGAVLEQNYPHHLMEVVISDGESTDGTLDLIEKVAAGSDIPVRTVQNPKKIAPAALNLAIAQARGDIFVRVDGHCEIEPDYVANCVKHLTDGSADGVGGPIETIGVGHQAKAISIAMSSKFGVGGSAFRTVNDREMYTDTVAFPGYTREIVERNGPFDEELVRNQDDEYNYRIRKLGGRILLSPDIRSRYYSRSTFRKLWSQYYQYGYWKVRVLQMHPKQMSVRQFVPFLFVVSLITFALIGLFTTVGLWMLAGIIALYLIANFAASVIAARSEVRIVPALSLSYLILHLSYGLGSLAGLLVFRDRWKDGQMSYRPAQDKTATADKL
jgi:succinoglycan biosynthesis protein ExoA